MNENDDQDWMDALAGREAAPSATTREAHALRAALRTAPRGARTGDSPRNVTALPDSKRENALIERAVREGVITAAKPRRRPGWPRPLAASVLLVVAAGIVLQLQSPHDTVVVRGSEDGIVRLQAPDAAALKQSILAELRAAGVSATGYEALGVHGIDADLTLPLSPEVKSVLAAHGIAEPPDGVLRIEIRSHE
jgi:hypothetical protein